MTSTMPDILQRHAAGVVFCLLLTASPVCAQQEPAEALETSGTAFYRYAQTGQNTIQVAVLGGGQSGIYEVGADIDLAKLLALSKGLGGDGRSKITVQLYRPENGRRELMFEAKMEEFLARSEYPTLETGDIVRIETVQRQRFGWRDVLSIITTATTLVFTIDRVADL